MLTSARLGLREWRDEDLAPWAALNADPRVREFFPNILTWEENAAQMRQARDHFVRHRFDVRPRPVSRRRRDRFTISLAASSTPPELRRPL